MKRHLKKVVLAMIAFVLCGVMNVTGSNVSLAATDVETEQTAELEAASTVRHVSARELYHAGDYLYIETSKGVLAYNMKKTDCKVCCKERRCQWSFGTQRISVLQPLSGQPDEYL